MAEIINGRALRDEILAELKDQIEKKDIEPKLAIIQVGENSESSRYIEQKKKSAEKIGALVTHYQLSPKVDFSQVKRLLAKLNRDKSTHGIIVQLPLPRQLPEEEISKLISVDKDVDGFKADSQFLPATPGAILEIFKRCDISLKGKTVVIVGRGKLVGKPLYEILGRKPEIKQLIQVHTALPKPLDFYTKQADILVSATGKPGLITKEMLKNGVVVIDVGINVDQETGKLCGDVDPEASALASKITPVPGGVGPMTVAMLLKNLVEAAVKQL